MNNNGIFITLLSNTSEKKSQENAHGQYENLPEHEKPSWVKKEIL